MFEMVRGLVARGHIVNEYCPASADLTYLPLTSLAKSTTVLPCRLLGLPNRRVRLLTPYIAAIRLAHDLLALAETARHGARVIQREGYDLVFSQDCQCALVPHAPLFLPGPRVHYFHVGTRALASQNSETEGQGTLLSTLKRAYYAPARGIDRWLRYWHARRNLLACDRVLTNSRFTASEILAAFGVESHVCYLGVDIARFRPLDLPRQNFVLSVGAVHPYKGYCFLIRALGRLPDARRPELVIAANGVDPYYVSRVRNVATQTGVRLTIRQIADVAEMVTLYNLAAAFVYAPIREPWGLAAVEAMACGTPVVAVAEGGVAESVTDGESGVLTARDEEAFASSLARVLQDRRLAGRLARAGIARVRSYFTWERTVDRLEAHFEQVTRSGGAE